ncbi:TolC family protein [Flavitalea sp. BT771]|uniref:TolC family protein n=1 Tax=Flavitalea sp. BT771 TaxID=3063329 RepID=UPI0026E42AAC|nr:TolC family protein [Flavitalea sp. BT771]MDO6431299.1 TolC family protein [Flavitalea sp. BT771]MDV6220207.1 TolC family protein [Flavitalea sp. BT771]
MKRIMYAVFVSSGLFILSPAVNAQKAPDTVLQQATLPQVVDFALKHYPLIQQAMLDEQITDRQIRSKLADWLPQLNLNASYQNNFQLQTINFNGTYVRSGVYNTSLVGLGLTQNIFNRDVLLASRTKNDAMKLSRQYTATDKINLVVNVSKAFYDVLLTQKQIEVLDDDIRRLERNLKDTYNQYQGGLVDKTDYKRATISLNNSKAQRKTNEEALKAKYSALQQLMGYTSKDSIHLVYDSAQMASDILVDTLSGVDFNNRIEYQALLTQKKLQQTNLQYEKWSYLPSLTANGAYNMNYLNNRFSKLYNDNFPNSYAGLMLSFPIFQGTKRTQNIRIAELQVQRLDWDIVNLQNSIGTEYAQALAAYKGYLNNYNVLRENLDLARDVFNTIELQYRSGIKAYLELITAETDLRNAQTNFSDALYQVLSSKLDVQKALGTIKF